MPKHVPYETDVNGEKKYLVTLTGPRRYRIGKLLVQRGEAVAVSKSQRDYLVLETGMFIDYDPTPPESFIREEGPLGTPQGPVIDKREFDQVRSIRPEALDEAERARQSGDATSEDMKGGKSGGGATAGPKKGSGGGRRKGTVNVSGGSGATASKPAASKDEAAEDAETVTLA